MNTNFFTAAALIIALFSVFINISVFGACILVLAKISDIRAGSPYKEQNKEQMNFGYHLDKSKIYIMDRNTSIFAFIIHFSLVFRFEKIFSSLIFNNYFYNEERYIFRFDRIFRTNIFFCELFFRKDLEHTNLITVSYFRNTLFIDFMLLENP